MDVLAARGAAPNYGLGLLVELGKANGAVTVDGLPVLSVGFIAAGGAIGRRRRMGEDIPELRAEQCQLVDELELGMQDSRHDLAR